MTGKQAADVRAALPAIVEHATEIKAAMKKSTLKKVVANGYKRIDILAAAVNEFVAISSYVTSMSVIFVAHSCCQVLSQRHDGLRRRRRVRRGVLSMGFQVGEGARRGWRTVEFTQVGTPD